MIGGQPCTLNCLALQCQHLAGAREGGREEDTERVRAKGGRRERDRAKGGEWGGGGETGIYRERPSERQRAIERETETSCTTQPLLRNLKGTDEPDIRFFQC